jgi:uroporphyrin-III C-methyltransferase/precorrin-2 dehydrogenase/sirohydrochlorin ferrochelatase
MEFSMSILSATEHLTSLDQKEYKKLDNTDSRVFLVGGGPGDPDLLTIKALKIIQRADVIVYDALITPEILALGSKDAEYICVGKKAGNHTLVQEKINQLLVDLANKGKVVCRLKGGDPYIYGRGGEEAQLLAKNNIAYQVIPGITAAAACSAAVGIPLTHRDYAQSLQFVTGHLKKPTDTSADVNWHSLASANQTLVIYMGIIQSPEIKTQLIKHGRAADTPVAIIEKGTRPDQRVVIGTLNTLDELVQTHKIGSPALIIVGEVVNLHAQLNGQDINNQNLEKQASQEAQQALVKLAVETQERATQIKAA